MTKSKSIIVNITKKRNIQLTKCMCKQNKVQINDTTLKTVISNPWGLKEEHDCISIICWHIIPQYTTFKFDSPFFQFQTGHYKYENHLFAVCGELVYFHQNMQKIQEVTAICDTHAWILKSDNYAISASEEYDMFYTVQQDVFFCLFAAKCAVIYYLPVFTRRHHERCPWWPDMAESFIKPQLSRKCLVRPVVKALLTQCFGYTVGLTFQSPKS